MCRNLKTKNSRPAEKEKNFKRKKKVHLLNYGMSQRFQAEKPLKFHNKTAEKGSARKCHNE